jgi:putative tryptophan/tyrosine transport system substrate-binding protein
MTLQKIGFFHNGMEESFTPHFAAFEARLLNFKFKAPTEVQILRRWAGDQAQKPLDDHISELLKEGVTVLVAAGGPPSALAAKKATEANRKPPVVFTSVADPVRLGLVKSLVRPDTHMTGIAGLTSELDVARLRLLNEVLGGGEGTRIGVLNNATRPLLEEQYKKIEVAASRMKLTLVRKDVASLEGIEAAFDAFNGGQRVAGLLVTADSLFNNHRKQVVALAAGMPAIYQWREFAEVGGFMSFGPNIIEAYAQVGDYAGRILDGEDPSQLPVALPCRFELVINIDVAYGGGFDIPASLLTQAEFVPTAR